MSELIDINNDNPRLPIDINIHASLSLREDGPNHDNEYSLQVIQKYNMNNVGDYSTGGLNKKDILTMEDLKGQETHFRVYSYILALIHQKHIQQKLFKYSIKHPEIIQIYAKDNTKIGIPQSDYGTVNESVNNYLLLTSNNQMILPAMRHYLSTKQTKEVKYKLKMCVPVYRYINGTFKTTTTQKLMYKFNKTKDLHIFLYKYSDLFYDYNHSKLKQKSYQLELMGKLFCANTDANPGITQKRFLDKYRERVGKYREGMGKIMDKIHYTRRNNKSVHPINA